MTWLLAALATPGVMFSGSQYYFYAHARTFTPAARDRILFISQAFHVDFAMAVAGLMTLLVWSRSSRSGLPYACGDRLGPTNRARLSTKRSTRRSRRRSISVLDGGSLKPSPADLV